MSDARVAATPPGVRLGPLDQIADGAARNFVLQLRAGRFHGFVVRRGDAVWGYVDRCPHAGVRPGTDLQGRTAIVVDDGVATGMTMQAALRLIRRSAPARLIAATPVAARDAAAMLRRESDQTVLLSVPRRFSSVGGFYRAFAQVTDQEVISLLRAANATASFG